METKSDTLRFEDTTVVVIYKTETAHDLSDSAIVEEVLHRYDRIHKDITSHDSTHGVVALLVLVAVILSILNRRRKNKNNG